MKSLTLPAAVLLALAAGGAQAATGGQISFTGHVMEDTCEVSVNGGGADASINLPSISTSDFDTVGSTAGEQRFTIALNGCTVGQTYKVDFASANVNPTTGNLAFNGEAMSMSGIELQIANEELEAIDLRTNANNVSKPMDEAGPLEFAYYARYVQTSELVSPGTADTALLYSIRYD
ncbi:MULTISPECIES: fimbrial protein [Pseudomonas]|jgi:major type 1 subunit fimbrin (pilin)|uniref:Fimbrial protein n=1 Tax=Pseudomonas citronellolis TaxID=53408 RepID=A0A127MM43_9PSED|nr:MULTISPECIES: fimbrial protein [Pseudomonas]KSW25993.1 hypothetical protein AOX63_20270 [Pseudomonas sp. ADP]AMO74336.1 Type-1 fimbrial protein, A chain precursor [Pseudomonas citronellolis]ANI13192.1 hypothetical protein A9C11_04000 [Pseudomonas citronellolis]KES20337.1 hypothetical protein FG99_29940 [Pseudomonas sp. AAC]KRW77579.1 hypothetical protein AO738_03305 [Pseudomonas citronellolis]